jgi:two-component system sensor histidine kinase AlgZ
MHPLLSSRKTTLLYFAAWFLVGILFTAIIVVSGIYPWSTAALIALPMIMLYAFVNLSSYYLCRVFPLGTTPFIKILAVFLAAGFITSALWSAAGNIWAIALEQAFQIPGVVDPYARQVPVFWGLGVLLFLLVSVIQYVFITFERSREIERQSYELRLLAQEAELRLLRAQIDPHFLFNSLNSVTSLIAEHPAEAREMSFRLADFLRESLRIGPLVHIPLREEIRLISDYLAIEQVRFGARLATDVHIELEAMEALVPPLILQPLVENAVRHGITHLLNGGLVLITARRRPAGLTVTVENPCDAERPRKTGTGLGLTNVRSRIRTLVGNDGWVDVDESDTYFRVTLVMPYRTTL